MTSNPLLTALPLILNLAPACSDNRDSSKDTPVFTGKIEDWQSDGNDNLYLALAETSSLLFLDSTTVSTDGSLSIPPPFPVPPAGMLRQDGHLKFVTNYALTVTSGWDAVMTRIVTDDQYTRSYEVLAGDIPEKKWFAGWFIYRGFELAAGF